MLMIEKCYPADKRFTYNTNAGAEKEIASEGDNMGNVSNRKFQAKHAAFICCFKQR